MQFGLSRMFAIFLDFLFEYSLVSSDERVANESMMKWHSHIGRRKTEKPKNQKCATRKKKKMIRDDVTVVRGFENAQFFDQGERRKNI